MTIALSAVDHTHALYPAILELRFRVLREPLGMTPAQLNTADDASYAFVIATHDGSLLGVVALDLCEHRLRQMAVAPAVQKQNIGRRLVARAEDEARSRGIATLTLHAREVARGFYLKLGYSPVGEPFEEVGIPHIEMVKTL